MTNTLSELVKLRIDLQRYADLSTIRKEIATTHQNLDSLPVSEKYAVDISKLRASVDKALAPLSKTDKLLESTIAKVTVDIDKMCRGMFAADYSLSKVCTVEQIRETPQRHLDLTEEMMTVLLGRIQTYADWHYPGMEIGPQDGKFTSQLVACDPLYLVDVYPEFLQSTASQFNEIYRARLRTYSIGTDGVKTKGLDDLPQNQFGFVFSWEVFNFLALETIKEYLIDVYKVLRPGGVFLFSYNDGDTYNGARNAEWGGSTFVPKRLLIPLCESIGYEIIESFNYQPGIQDISWIEIRKPGNKSTVKAHQVLGMVKEVSK